MNLLEVKNISKTYGNGETAVNLNGAVMWQSSGNPVLEKYTAEYDRCFGHANIWQGSD